MTSIERAVSPMAAFGRTGRELNRLGQSTELAISQRGAVADIECAALDGLQQVAGRAMQGVALVSQLEQHLSAVVPEAEGRLRAISDIHAISSAEIVARAPRRLG